jgi:hypothetical protein
MSTKSDILKQKLDLIFANRHEHLDFFTNLIAYQMITPLAATYDTGNSGTKRVSSRTLAENTFLVGFLNCDPSGTVANKTVCHL